MIKILTVKVIPRASTSQIIEEAAVWKIKLRSVPANGKANAELISILAERFGVSQSRVEITRGLTSRIKLVTLDLP